MPPTTRKNLELPVLTAAHQRRLRALSEPLNQLYTRYNDRGYVHPDPLAPVYGYTDPRDQEIVALIAASLAFGNVKQILKSIDIILRPMPEPAAMVAALSAHEWALRLEGFRHRYVTGVEMASLLAGAGAVIRDFGSLGACFAAMDEARAPTLLPALIRFVGTVRTHGTLGKNYLLPDPALGSACKRWFMFLRWMVREDTVDLGLWRDRGADRLIVPVDTHMHRVALGLGLTRRTTADLRTALEITRGFQVICPADPVRYDFCLTRLGIRDDGDMPGFLREVRTAR